MYTSLTALIPRFSGQELVQLGWPDLPQSYLGASVSASALVTDWPTAVADDVALAQAEDAIYRYDGAAWHVFAAGMAEGIADYYVTTATLQALTSGGTVMGPAWNIEFADPA